MNKTEMLRAACTPKELQAARDVAENEGVKVPELLRLLVRREAKERGFWSNGARGQATTRKAA